MFLSFFYIRQNTCKFSKNRMILQFDLYEIRFCIYVSICLLLCAAKNAACFITEQAALFLNVILFLSLSQRA